jgi:hypothetical protein
MQQKLKLLKDRIEKKYGTIQMFDRSLFHCEYHGTFEDNYRRLSHKAMTIGCRQCTLNARRGAALDHPSYVKELSKRRKDVRVLGTYHGMNEKISHRCKTCGNVWDVRPANLLNAKSGCPKCAGLSKHVTVGGRDFRVRGFEASGLRYLVTNGISPNQIIPDNDPDIPKFTYLCTTSGKLRVYTPDFYIPDFNTIVEVKSMSSLGLDRNAWSSTPQQVFQRNVDKAIEVRDQGYKFMLLVMHRDGRRFYLPSTWYLQTRKQCRTWARKMGLYWDLIYNENHDLTDRLRQTQETL